MFEILKPYESVFNHSCDFRVSYQFLNKSDGGQHHLPHQSLRSDFRYADPNICERRHGDFIIWPEFEDNEGNLIESGIVLKEGTARMWVINASWRKFHSERIALGTKGYFLQGGQIIAHCQVIEIVGLLINPR